MATRMVSALLPAPSPPTDVTAATMSSLTSMNTWSPSCSDGGAGGQRADAEAHQVGHPGAGRVLQRPHRSADPVLVHGHLDDRHGARRVAEDLHVALRHQVAQHPVRRPPHGRHGGDAQPLVDLRPALVVDAGDDPGHAERLAGQPGRDDVGVVAAGHRREGVRAFDAGLVAAPRRSKPAPVTVIPAKSGPSRRNASASWSITDTECPRDSRLWARVEPTRPHPMITTCTLSLPRCAPLPMPWSSDCEPATSRSRAGTDRTPPSPAAVIAHPRAPAAVVVPLAFVASPTSLLKRLLLGRPFRSDRLQHTLLPKRIALPVFASDALSSVAYAPDEILLTLSIAGAVRVRRSRRGSPWPWSWSCSPWWPATGRTCTPTRPAAATTRWPRSTWARGSASAVASALLVDYVLTVAVSVSSGVANLGSVVPFVATHKVADRGRARWSC